MLAALRGWSGKQKHVVAASYLAWAFDALDFFLLVFVITDIAHDFAVGVPAITVAVTLTLACRPIGAFLFGRLADRYGRRPVLIANIFVYSSLSLATAFVPNLFTFLLVRAAFGVGMGGVWGIGSSLAMETIPAKARGIVSGLLQSGYASGYLLASIIFAVAYPVVGWRGMFVVGIIPSMLLILYVYWTVPESPSFGKVKKADRPRPSVLRDHWRLALYAIVLMTAFNFFSHGTQDLYPTFLKKYHGLNAATVGQIAIIYNVGAVLGCLLFGSLSERFGRRRMMISAALCAIPTIWLWAFGSSLLTLAIGAFLINFFVQGCWSIIPAYLNELSPGHVRGTFPGTVYQLGNLVASSNLTIQAMIAERTGNYGIALGGIALAAALVISGLLLVGPEAKGVHMDA